jgi:hypothetical protein
MLFAVVGSLRIFVAKAKTEKGGKFLKRKKGRLSFTVIW